MVLLCLQLGNHFEVGFEEQDPKFPGPHLNRIWEAYSNHF